MNRTLLTVVAGFSTSSLLPRSEQTIPVVWGVVRHRLLLPAAAREWSAEQLQSVLLHELGHIKRRGTIARLLAQLACALHWFNPLVWFAARRLRRLQVERERACDDLVLASGERASAYAEHLHDVATRLSSSPWTRACGLAIARNSSLEDRLKAVFCEKRNRRSVTSAIVVVSLMLGAAIAIPVSTLRATDAEANEPAGQETAGEVKVNIAAAAAVEPPVAPAAAADDEPPAATPAAPAAEVKPQHAEGQELFRIWQANSRTDGKIPGALIGRLGEWVKYFIELNDGHEMSLKFQQLLPRFDATSDWTPAEAIALLDDVSAIHSIPLRNSLDAAAERVILPGESLPAELVDAPWGQPTASGLRVAWLLEPRAKEYRLGTSLKSRILVHNSGKQAVFFIMPSWQQSSTHAAHDAKDKAITVSATSWTTVARMRTYRLAPGAYCETPAPGIGVGARTTDEDWANIRPGAWVEAKAGDEVRLTPGAVELRMSPFVTGIRHMNELQDPKDAADLWKKFVGERIARETPIPTGAADREQLLRRLTLDLFSEEPSSEEIAAFVADKSPAATHPIASRDLLAIRVQHGRSLVPFTGTLPPGDIKFRVLAADAEAAKKPPGRGSRAEP